MTESEKSQLCLKQGQEALKKHDYKAVHRIAMQRLLDARQDPAAYYLLAHIALDHGNTKKAEELFQQAYQYGKSEARYTAAYAKILSLRGNQKEARIYNERATKLPIDEAIVADTIGVVFSRTGFHEKAISYYHHAISLDPEQDNFHFNIGASLKFLGKFKEAAFSYKKAIELNPDNVRAYSSLVSLEKQTAENNVIEELIRLFDRHRADADKSLHIGHAIAKSLEDLERYQESLTWLHKAKSLKRDQVNFYIDSYLSLFEAAKQTALWPDQSVKSETQTESPIFIIGLPRTGTTLVDRILSSHPDVISCGELNEFAGLVKARTQTPSKLVLDKETLLAAKNLNLQEIGQEYWTNTKLLRQGYLRMTDKMPLNFFYAALINRAFPNARIICLRRGAMDSCLSNYRQLFSTSYSYYNYTLSLHDTAAFYKQFDSLIAHWAATLPVNRFMQIQYENIVFNQEFETRRLLDFCGLSWNEACLHFHKNAAPVSTASSVQVRQPLYSGSIGRWKKYGNMLDDLRHALGDLAE